MLLNKEIIVNIFNVFIIRGLGLIISFFMIPAYMRYFDNQSVLGIWFTIISILNWILTFDLGIGNGLRNKLIKPFLSNDKESVRIYISSAYIMSGLLTAISMFLGCLFLPMIDWNSLLKVSDQVISSDKILTIIYILFFGALLQFWLKMIHSIYYALQKSSLPSLLNLISSFFLLIYILFATVKSIEENFFSLAIVNAIFTTLPLLAATIILFFTKLKYATPSFSFFKFSYAAEVIKLGGTFFWLQMMSLLITSTNEILITLFSDAANVVDFQIYSKLFSLIGTIYFLSLTPIWSAVTKAFAQGDFVWIKKLYKILSIAALIFIIGKLALIFALQSIVDLWLGDKSIIINMHYAFIFALSGSLFIWHSTITSIVNGIGKLKIQLIFLTIGGLANIPVAYLIFYITGSWISIIIANIISLIPYLIVQTFYINKIISNSETSREGIPPNISNSKVSQINF